MSVHFGASLLDRPSERGVMRPQYHEGSLFAVPLTDGGYGAGLVARLAPGSKIMLAYLFGLRFERLPSLEALPPLGPQDAVKVLRVGDMALANRRWPVLGEYVEWNPQVWPMPQFLRRMERLQRAWRVTYADADPSRSEREESVPFDTPGLEADSLYGYGSTELLLTKLLSLH